MGHPKEDEPEKRKDSSNDGGALRMAREILYSLRFSSAIGVIIALNAVTIGVEQSLDIAGKNTTPVKVIDSIFLVIYIIELGLRFFVEGNVAFRDMWVRLDAFLVTTGVFSSWILEPLMTDSPDELGLMMTLRMARLLRLAKTARLLKQVREFWMLIRGFMNSASLMFYTFGILTILVYIFSCIAIEIITKHSLNTGPEPDKEFQEHVDRYFSSLPIAMMTIMRFVCLDQMGEVYEPLVLKDHWLAVYFVFLMVVIGIVAMNLISAVIFSTCVEQNAHEENSKKSDEEEEFRRTIIDLKNHFNEMDKAIGDNGILTRSEVLGIDAKSQKKICRHLGDSTPMQVFQALDTEGTVGINEFFDSLWDIGLSRAPVDLKRIEKQVQNMAYHLDDFMLNDDISRVCKELLEKLDTLQAYVTAMRTMEPVNAPVAAPWHMGDAKSVSGAELDSLELTVRKPSSSSWKQPEIHKRYSFEDRHKRGAAAPSPSPNAELKFLRNLSPGGTRPSAGSRCSVRSHASMNSLFSPRSPGVRISQVFAPIMNPSSKVAAPVAAPDQHPPSSLRGAAGTSHL